MSLPNTIVDSEHAQPVNVPAYKVEWDLDNICHNAFGSSATALSSQANYPASACIDGDKTHTNWGTLASPYGGWQSSVLSDGTGHFVVNEWLEINFGQSRKINRIKIFSYPKNDLLWRVNSNYLNPPTNRGLKSFTIQYWTGSAWQNWENLKDDRGGTGSNTITNGVVTVNTKTYNIFKDDIGISTNKIKILIHDTQSASQPARILEVECYRTIRLDEEINISHLIVETGESTILPQNRIMSIEINRRKDYEFNKYAIGQVTLTCHNYDRKLSSQYVPTPDEITNKGYFNSQIHIRQEMRLFMGFDKYGFEELLKMGEFYIADLDPNTNDMTIRITLKDKASKLLKKDVSIGNKLIIDYFVEELIEYVGLQGNISVDEMVLDNTTVTVANFFPSIKNLWTTMQDLADALGKAGVFFDENGYLRYECYLQTIPHEWFQTSQADFQAGIYNPQLVDLISEPDNILNKLQTSAADFNLGTYTNTELVTVGGDDRIRPKSNKIDLDFNISETQKNKNVSLPGPSDSPIYYYFRPLYGGYINSISLYLTNENPLITTGVTVTLGGIDDNGNSSSTLVTVNLPPNTPYQWFSFVFPGSIRNGKDNEHYFEAYASGAPQSLRMGYWEDLVTDQYPLHYIKEGASQNNNLDPIVKIYYRGYYMASTYTSGIYDYLLLGKFYTRFFGLDKITDLVDFNGRTAIGTNLNAHIVPYSRSGNVPVPDGTWEAWMEVDMSEGKMFTADARYFQFRLEFSQNNKLFSLQISSINIPATFISQTKDLTIVPNVWGNLVCNFLESMTKKRAIQFYTQTSADGITWDAQQQILPLSFIQGSGLIQSALKRYIRWIVYISSGWQAGVNKIKDVNIYWTTGTRHRAPDVSSYIFRYDTTLMDVGGLTISAEAGGIGQIYKKVIVRGSPYYSQDRSKQWQVGKLEFIVAGTKVQNVNFKDPCMPVAPGDSDDIGTNRMRLFFNTVVPPGTPVYTEIVTGTEISNLVITFVRHPTKPTITLVAAAAATLYDGFIDARPFQHTGDILKTSEATALQKVLYDGDELLYENPYLFDGDLAQYIANDFIALHAEPRPRLTSEIRIRFCPALQITDRITIVDIVTNLNNDYQVFGYRQIVMISGGTFKADTFLNAMEIKSFA